MQPLTASIHYEDPNYNLTIVVRQATAMDGMRRSALIGQVIGLTKTQRESEDAQELMDGLSRYWLGLAWAACRATTVEVTAAEGEAPFTRDISFEDFQALPDALVTVWGNECMRLNPHWAPKGLEDDEGGSKQPATTSNDG
jgi:hypothetical protein